MKNASTAATSIALSALTLAIACGSPRHRLGGEYGTDDGGAGMGTGGDGTGGTAAGGSSGSGAASGSSSTNGGGIGGTAGTAGTAGEDDGGAGSGNAGSGGGGNACVSNPCQNGGTCFETPDGAACDCLPGITGPLCELTMSKVSAGDYHTCGLRSDGTIACWGNNEGGQATPPSGTFADVVAGNYASCALREDGSIACWGRVAAPPTGGGFHGLTVGMGHGCALNETGALSCWGNAALDVGAPPGPFRTVVAAERVTCGIETTGALSCWGMTTGTSGVLQGVPAGTFTAVSTAGDHGCAIRTDESIVCWGSRSAGIVEYPGRFAAVGVGEMGQTCAEEDGQVACWSYDYPAPIWTEPSGDFTMFDAGKPHACGVRPNGSVECWGSPSVLDIYGQATPPGRTFTDIALGAQICGIRSDGTIACFSGVLPPTPNPPRVPPVGTYRTLIDDGRALTTDSRFVCWRDVEMGPTPVPEEGVLSAVFGATHGCAALLDGSVTCWGDDLSSYGLLNPPSGSFKSLEAGADFTCGIRTDDSVACWGNDASGQSSPPSGSFETLSASGAGICGLRTDGTIACWGETPASPPEGTFESLDIDGPIGCAAKRGSRAVCWGTDTSGLGLSMPPDQSFVALSLSGTRSCGLGEDRKMTCWGLLAR